jgi:hypothetical protein
MKRFGLLSALLLLGCGVTESSVVGDYHGEVAGSERDGKVVKGLEQDLASTITLSLKPDHTFKMVAAIVPISGSWALNGSTVTCTPQEVFGFSHKPLGAIQLKAIDGALETDFQSKHIRFVRDPAGK